MEPTETKSSRKKIIPVILVLVVLSALVFGVSKFIYSLHHEDTDDAQIDGDISPVLARVSGYVNEIRFEDNQKISKGDTLVKLDDRDLRIKVEQADAALENSRSNVSVARANTVTARANFETSQSNVENAKVRLWKATQDFTRYQNLLADKSVTQQQFDAVKAEKESAETQVDVFSKQQNASSAQVHVSDEQVTFAESMVASRQAEVDFAKLQLSYANILSPSSGFATKKNIQPGQLVNAGSPLFAVVSDSGIYVIANFKETQLEKMNKGQTVQVIADGLPGKKIEGLVYSFSAATGAKFSLLPPDNATGNFVKVVQRVPVKISLKTDPELKEKLRPGMSVKVSVLVN